MAFSVWDGLCDIALAAAC